MATSVLDEFIFDQDVMLPAPPQTSWDFTEASGIANTVGVRTVETGLNRHNRPSPKIISSECLHINTCRPLLEMGRGSLNTQPYRSNSS